MNDQPIIEFYGIPQPSDRVEILARIRREMLRFGARPCHDGDNPCLSLRMGFNKFFLFEDSVRWFADTGYTEAWMASVMLAAWLRFRAQGRLDRLQERSRRLYCRVLLEEIALLDQRVRAAGREMAELAPDPSGAIDAEA